MELFKAPGVAETLDWTSAVIALDQQALSPQIVADTLGVILKYQDDIETVHTGNAERDLRTLQAASRDRAGIKPMPDPIKGVYLGSDDDPSPLRGRPTAAKSAVVWAAVPGAGHGHQHRSG